MVDDIKVTEDELNNLFSEVDQLLKDIESLSGRDKTDVCFSSCFCDYPFFFFFFFQCLLMYSCMVVVMY